MCVGVCVQCTIHTCTGISLHDTVPCTMNIYNKNYWFINKIRVRAICTLKPQVTNFTASKFGPIQSI